MEKSITVSDFIFGFVHLLYHKCCKMNPNRKGSYIDSPDWTNKATINPINKKCKKSLECVVKVTLNQEKIGKKS